MRSRTSKKFTARLFRYPGAGGWHFAPIPDKHAPPVTHSWGRTPVQATVDGHEWKTSVWRGSDDRTLLAIPKRVRGTKGHGDAVDVRITFDGPPRRKFVKGAITAAAVRRLAMDMPEATAGSHFDTPDFRVRKKIFDTLPETGDAIVVKSEPAAVEAMRWLDAETYADAARGRWLRVRLDRVSLPVLRDLIAEAWRLAAPNRLAATFDVDAP